MRFIDAEPLKEKAFYHEIDCVSYVEEEDIDKAPTVDAVQVVRCKDCKYSKEYSDKQFTCKWFDTLVFPNGFCSNGKRREANET